MSVEASFEFTVDNPVVSITVDVPLGIEFTVDHPEATITVE